MSVTASRLLSCQAGARLLGACSPPLAARRDSLDRDPAARPAPGPLGVRNRPRHRHPVPVRALGPRGLGRHGRWHPLGELITPHPGTAPWHAGGGLSTRRCRGWQISPEPAGTGRASRIGETAARLHANAEGPRCGSRPPVAGGGVCGRGARGRTSPHPATRGTGKENRHAVRKKTGRAPAWQNKPPGSDMNHRNCSPGRQENRENGVWGKAPTRVTAEGPSQTSGGTGWRFQIPRAYS